MLHLQTVNVAQIHTCFLDTRCKRLLTLADPDTGVVELLVGLVSSLGVTDLGQEVILLLENEVSDPSQVGELGVGINVHLDNTVIDGSVDLFFGRARASVEDKVEGFLFCATELLASVGLVLAKKLRLQLDIPRFVHTVHVTESSRDTEVRADLAQSSMDIVDVFRLGVKSGIVDSSVVHTIFLSTSDADLHFEPETEGSHSPEVFYADLDVLVLRLLRKIEHVGREERLLVNLEVFLISGEHTIKPGQEFVSTVVTVENDGNAILLCDRSDVVGGCFGSGDGGLLLVVSEPLSSEIRTSSLGYLENDGRLNIPCGFQGGVSGGRGGNVYSWDGELVLLCIVEQFTNVVSSQNTSGDDIEDTHG